MKVAGIWIDKKIAKIVSIEAGNERLVTITSEVEDFHPSGGSGTKQKGGPQDVVQDSKYLEREKHQLAAFFKDITKNIEDADEIVIFGPAQAGKKLCANLLEKHPPIYDKVMSVEKSDKLTDNQIVAWVIDYYNSNL